MRVPAVSGIRPRIRGIETTTYRVTGRLSEMKLARRSGRPGTPERNLVDELMVATDAFPAPARDRDRSEDTDQVAEAVDVDEERPDPDAVVAWAREGAQRERRGIFSP